MVRMACQSDGHRIRRCYYGAVRFSAGVASHWQQHELLHRRIWPSIPD